MDHVLIARVTQGDLVAFEVLVKKYRQSIINFACRALGDPIEAQDVAQNVFVKAFKESGRFRFESRFSTWLYAITRNLCRNELHRRSLRQMVSLNCEDAGYGRCAGWDLEDERHENSREAVSQAELQEKVEQCLALLPERQRKAILLLQDQGLSYAELAVSLGTSVPAIKAMVHRGRQALKRKLRPYLRNGAWPAVPKNVVTL